ncbi:hypothetical protein, variant [Saprolegnia diclina VS20]|uniref:Ion transport domain-containing protein n=1 Tax=Saprolegnia diclina (strain VS20) TaxID=1156394 RepID=T0PXW7_SAPDV|nr:hypothetical protein SDRG_16258 [Saprolegnia diclina VS20]XP_008620682.1 hypothetical protein, variant [Saprolegnia diclina VS20]EQC25885.1 hypothetical protein SDRG_16258 [Saprolegnia diclina VS20]EQC25886.1 hypothetical protein, variant [Saprolegnia diclina VS20]|eukprot:XP_008620681.1 hypothetical protein SDRG_16258 [Saprolegnia diclina VS20]
MALDAATLATASWFVEDAFSGVARPHPVQGAVARRLYTLYAELHYVRGLALLLLVSISFVEVPAWCGASCGDPDDDATPVTFGLPMLPRTQSVLLEAACLLLLLANSMLRYLYLRESFFAGRRDSVAVLLLLLVAALTLVASETLPMLRPLQVYLRGAIAATKNRSLRRTARKIYAVLNEVQHALVLIFVYVAFCSWVATVLFHHTTEGTLYLGNIYEASWNLFVLLTTANFPDVFMPAYSTQRSSVLFFVFFLCFGLFFLLNVVLAVTYTAFTRQLAAFKRKRRRVQVSKLQVAFQLLCHVDGQRAPTNYSSTELWAHRHDDWTPPIGAAIPKATCLRLFETLNHYKNIPYLKHDKMKTLFATLDIAQDDQLSWPEFARLCSVFHTALATRTLPPPELQRYCPRLYYSAPFQKLARLVCDARLDTFVDTLLVINAVVIVLESFPVLNGDATVPIETEFCFWERVEGVFSLVYVVEMIVKVLVYGRATYWASLKHRFDAILTIAMATVDIYALSSAYAASRALVQILLVARCLRLCRLILNVQRFRVVCLTWLRLLPLCKHLMLFLASVMYLFAAFGMHLFGGRISVQVLEAQCPTSPFTTSGYGANNFNDMASGVVLLFELLVVNNWSALADGFVCVTSQYARWYFVAYYVASVMVLLNLVVATTLDAFAGEYDAEHKANASPPEASGVHDSV